MNGIRNVVLGALLSLAGALPSLAAMPLTGAPAAGTDVVNARIVCDRFGCWDTTRPGVRPFPPGYRPPPLPGAEYPRPPIYRPPPPPPPIYRPLPPPIYRPPPPIYRPPPPVYGVPADVWRRHVQWCLNRYRSYNPQTNRYLGYDGYYKICRSPYSW